MDEMHFWSYGNHTGQALVSLASYMAMGTLAHKGPSEQDSYFSIVRCLHEILIMCCNIQMNVNQNSPEFQNVHQNDITHNNFKQHSVPIC
jgi:hypothetical protein